MPFCHSQVVPNLFGVSYELLVKPVTFFLCSLNSIIRVNCLHPVDSCLLQRHTLTNNGFFAVDFSYHTNLYLHPKLGTKSNTPYGCAINASWADQTSKMCLKPRQPFVTSRLTGEGRKRHSCHRSSGTGEGRSTTFMLRGPTSICT